MPNQQKHPSYIIVKKELRLLFKSKRRILLFAAIPIIFVIIGLVTAATTSYVTNLETKKTNVWVIDENPTNFTLALRTVWNSINNTNFQIVTNNNIQQLMANKSFEILVFIPQNFTSLLLNNQSISTISIYYSYKESNYQIIASQIATLTEQFEFQLIKYDNPNVKFNLINEKLLMQKNESGGIPKELVDFIIIIPIYGIFLVIISPMSLILISVTIEREQKTLETLFLQPVKRSSIILGKIYYGATLIIFQLLLNIISIYILILSLKPTFSISDLSAIGDSIKQTFGFIGPWELFIFILGIALMALAIISLAIFLSLVAKDEREANMVSGIIPIFLISVIFLFFIIPFNDLPIFGQILCSIIPMIGFIISIYLALLSGSLGIVLYISLASQIIWNLLFVWATVKISEAESILELTWGKVIKEIFSFIHIKNRKGK